MIDTWDTPTFYFIENGDLAAKVVGWPKEGQLEALKDGIRKIGIALDTGTRPSASAASQ